VTTPLDIRTLVLVLDLAGTAVFAVSRAAIGVKHRLDVASKWFVSGTVDTFVPPG
jgi:hypothetical protein